MNNRPYASKPQLTVHKSSDNDYNDSENISDSRITFKANRSL